MTASAYGGGREMKRRSTNNRRKREIQADAGKGSEQRLKKKKMPEVARSSWQTSSDFALSRGTAWALQVEWGRVRGGVEREGEVHLSNKV